jgi:hypothetical protein
VTATSAVAASLSGLSRRVRGSRSSSHGSRSSDSHGGGSGSGSSPDCAPAPREGGSRTGIPALLDLLQGGSCPEAERAGALQALCGMLASEELLGSSSLRRQAGVLDAVHAGVAASASTPPTSTARGGPGGAAGGAADADADTVVAALRLLHAWAGPREGAAQLVQHGRLLPELVVRVLAADLAAGPGRPRKEQRAAAAADCICTVYGHTPLLCVHTPCGLLDAMGQLLGSCLACPVRGGSAAAAASSRLLAGVLRALRQVVSHAATHAEVAAVPGMLGALVGCACRPAASGGVVALEVLIPLVKRAPLSAPDLGLLFTACNQHKHDDDDSFSGAFPAALAVLCAAHEHAGNRRLLMGGGLPAWCVPLLSSDLHRGQPRVLALACKLLRMCAQYTPDEGGGGGGGGGGGDGAAGVPAHPSGADLLLQTPPPLVPLLLPCLRSDAADGPTIAAAQAAAALQALACHASPGGRDALLRCHSHAVIGELAGALGSACPFVFAAASSALVAWMGCGPNEIAIVVHDVLGPLVAGQQLEACELALALETAEAARRTADGHAARAAAAADAVRQQAAAVSRAQQATATAQRVGERYQGAAQLAAVDALRQRDAAASAAGAARQDASAARQAEQEKEQQVSWLTEELLAVEGRAQQLERARAGMAWWQRGCIGALAFALALLAAAWVLWVRFRPRDG